MIPMTTARIAPWRSSFEKYRLGLEFRREELDDLLFRGIYNGFFLVGGFTTGGHIRSIRRVCFLGNGRELRFLQLDEEFLVHWIADLLDARFFHRIEEFPDLCYPGVNIGRARQSYVRSEQVPFDE
jgi:hypothetical protein